MSQSYGKLPLSFEVNEGQTDARVKFLSRGNGYTLFLTSTEAVLSLSKPVSLEPHDGMRAEVSRKRLGDKKPLATTVLRMKLVGANPAPEVTGLDQLPGKSNYFIGNDPKKWRTNVFNYARVKVHDIYPGVDVLYYGNQRELEYDLVVTPGGDPQAIRVGIEGAKKVVIDAQGDLVLHTDEGDVRLHKPTVYQELDGAKQAIAGHYVLRDDRQAGFEVGAYDASKPLVIDPVLSYSAYLGGSGSDNSAAIAVDSAGNAYVTGQTGSTNFPTTSGAFQTSFAGGDGLFIGVAFDAFVTKVNPTGSALIYSTYLGGSRDDAAIGITVDSAGSAYVTGLTDSTNFPTTSGAFQTSFGGGTSDAFVTKLNASGSALVYSTYLGGSGTFLCCAEEGYGIAVDSTGSAYVAGTTPSTNFPTTSGAFQTSFGGGSLDAFVTKLNATGSALVYSTYVGGSGFDIATGIAIDSTGSVYVTGLAGPSFPTTSGAFQTSFAGGFDDAFVTKLNPTGSALVYSTYLGGSSSENTYGIAVDSAGNAYVAGPTGSTDFPTTSGAFQTSFAGGSLDAFVTKLNPTGAALVYSTYLGGSGNDVAIGIAVDSVGSAYVAGYTGSTNLPTANPIQAANAGGFDAFVTKLNATGSALVYSTYLGGSGNDFATIAVDSVAAAYVSGGAGSNFPTTPGAFQTTFGGGQDAFVAKITDFASLSSGSFVVGDLNATVGNTVTFWGAQWAKVNSLSGGSAPNAFKGFADQTSTVPPSCGGTWTTDPANSSEPPASVPSFMAVIVSNSITESGATISGDVAKIVVVQTNAGYGPSPGHTGTGTVVAVLCSN